LPELPHVVSGPIKKGEAQRGESMKSEAISVEVLSRVYLELAQQLKQCGDRRQPAEVVNLAIKAWLASNGPDADRHGYQWKELFLPNGTELRLRYQGDYYYASISDDELLYADEAVSPRGWALMVTGTVRNAWRDMWIRRSVHEPWTRACDLRPKRGGQPFFPVSERRRYARRSDD
jgi:hypothetical protein